MQAFLLFITKYWKPILLVIASFFAWRKLTAILNQNYVSTSYNESGARLTKQESLAYANRLYLSMDGVGTDNETINSIRSSLTNPADLRAVYNAFGTKNYGFFGSSWSDMWGTPLDLKGWFKEELSPNDYKVWEQMFKTAGII